MICLYEIVHQVYWLDSWSNTVNAKRKFNSDEHKDIFATGCLITGYISGTEIRKKIVWNKGKKYINMWNKEGMYPDHHTVNPQADIWFAETEKSFECTLK
jgi:hypothetical protein